ncbi:MAG TPA: ferritin-like domain-containing protein [Gaiellaceae bacterium]
MTATLSRADVLRRGLLGGGGAVLASGALRSVLAAPAAALAAPGGDLAALRLLIGTELLALDFQERALASGKLDAQARVTVKRMHADEHAHYAGLADLMSLAGQAPATADDIAFTYASGAFSSAASILKLAAELETLQLGAYVGASADVETAPLRTAIAQISANEAQHVAALSTLAGRPAIGKAFAAALRPQAVTAVLDAFES